MTNDKDSAVLDEDFEIVVGRKHHETKVSQAKLLQLINGGAKIHHIKALRHPTQSDALRDLLEQARDRIDEMERNSGSSYEADYTPEEETLLGLIDAALQEQSNG